MNRIFPGSDRQRALIDLLDDEARRLFEKGLVGSSSSHARVEGDVGGAVRFQAGLEGPQERGHTRAIENEMEKMSLAVPVRFDTISEQKRDETTRPRTMTVLCILLLVETVFDVIALGNRPCVTLKGATRSRS